MFLGFEVMGGWEWCFAVLVVFLGEWGATFSPHYNSILKAKNIIDKDNIFD